MHSTFLYISPIPIKDCDEVFTLPTGDQQKLYVKVRPMFFEIIRELKMYYEIIVYSSVSQLYNQCIFDCITKREGSIISHVLSNTHCVLDTSKGTIKCLDILKMNRDPNNILCIDCNMLNYCLCIENFIPVTQYDGVNSGDEEMHNLLAFLMEVGKYQASSFVELVKDYKSTSLKGGCGNGLLLHL